jgi:hypothetical protein
MTSMSTQELKNWTYKKGQKGISILLIALCDTLADGFSNLIHFAENKSQRIQVKLWNYST